MGNNKFAQEFARAGGNAKLRKFGKKAFSDMGKKSAEARKAKYGTQLFSELGKKGSEARWKHKKKTALDHVAELFEGK